MDMLNRPGSARPINIWPGFVDALSALLMVVIFVLMVFMVAQFYLSNLLTGRDAEVQRLTRLLAEETAELELEQTDYADLLAQFQRLSADLTGAYGERDTLAEQVQTLETERSSLAQQLAAAISRSRTLNVEVSTLNEELLEAMTAVEAGEEAITLQLAEIASLQTDIMALRTTRETLETEVATLGLALEAARSEAEQLGLDLEDQTAIAEGLREQLGLTNAELLALRDALAEREDEAQGLEQLLADAQEQSEALTVELRVSREDRDRIMEQMAALRDRTTALETELSDEQERTVLAQRTIEERDVRIEELVRAVDTTEAALDDEQELTTRQRDELANLSEEVSTLTDQLQRIETALRESEAAVGDRDLEIADLNARLNQALIRRVEELSRYRSEFFGELREVLGNRPGIRVEGDRFVFQSEVLFRSGSASLQPGGRDQLSDFADTLMEIAAGFPDDIDWILRVDGHTDPVPIVTAQFPSNWELSTARATEVVRYLAAQGVPPFRLAAAGFAEFQPLVEGDDPGAFSRNRRIELRLDQR